MWTGLIGDAAPELCHSLGGGDLQLNVIKVSGTNELHTGAGIL